MFTFETETLSFIQKTAMLFEITNQKWTVKQ